MALSLALLRISPRKTDLYGPMKLLLPLINALKQALVSAPVLQLPDFSSPFTVECDASSDGVGAILTQSDHLVIPYCLDIADIQKGLTHDPYTSN